MSPSVHWASLATSSPMGQQHYESKIQEAMRRLASDGWHFAGTTVASLRAEMNVDVRLPMRLVSRAPAGVAALAGRALYPRADLMHRFDLRVPPGRLPEVVTVHDLPPARFADEGSLPRFAIRSARRAAGVICPSRFAEEEIRQLCGVERIWVIPYGLSEEFRRPSPLAEAELAGLGVTGRYVVHAAGATTRKNLAALADAWRMLASRHPDVMLVLCGPPDRRRTDLFSALPRVAMPGRLPPLTVAGLMAGAAAVAVPSTYEGFGLPALEGMAAGAPVVAARAGALPEVCGEAARLVEPTGEGLAEGLDDVLSDPDEADRLAAPGRERAMAFDWATAARAHLQVYQEILGS
ncbi:MAG TPA: glycosyltransferase family 1 protein [Acidimicrobiales bacterium]|jgi:glycosyltransferase involved in cell wall biosynthesis|nr:glycosyltransferase family 1 protein [Acidimicrobiales bacterium]